MCSFSTRNLRLDSTRNLSKLVLDRYYLDPKMFSSYFEILNWKDSISVTVYLYINNRVLVETDAAQGGPARQTGRRGPPPGSLALPYLERLRTNCLRK